MIGSALRDMGDDTWLGEAVQGMAIGRVPIEGLNQWATLRVCGSGSCPIRFADATGTSSAPMPALRLTWRELGCVCDVVRTSCCHEVRRLTTSSVRPLMTTNWVARVASWVLSRRRLAKLQVASLWPKKQRTVMSSPQWRMMRRSRLTRAGHMQPWRPWTRRSWTERWSLRASRSNAERHGGHGRLLVGRELGHGVHDAVGDVGRYGGDHGGAQGQERRGVEPKLVCAGWFSLRSGRMNVQFVCAVLR